MNSNWQYGNFPSRNTATEQFTSTILKEDNINLNIYSINAKPENSNRSIEDLRYEFYMKRVGKDTSSLLKYVSPANQITPQRSSFSTSNITNEVMMYDGAKANSGFHQSSSNLYSGNTPQNAYRSQLSYSGTGNQPAFSGSQPGFGGTTGNQINPFSQSSGFPVNSFGGGTGTGNAINTNQFNVGTSNLPINSQNNPFTQNNGSFGNLTNPNQTSFGNYSQASTGFFNPTSQSQLNPSNQSSSIPNPFSSQISFGVPNTSQPMNPFAQASMPQNQNLSHISQNHFSQPIPTSQGQTNPFFQNSSTPFNQNSSSSFNQTPNSNLYSQPNPIPLNQNLSLYNQGPSNFFVQNPQPTSNNFGYPTGQNINPFSNVNSMLNNNNFMTTGNPNQNNFLRPGLNGFLPENQGFGQNFNQGTYANIDKNLYAKEYMFNAFKDPHGLSWIYFDFDSLKNNSKPIEKVVRSSPEAQPKGNIEAILKNSRKSMPRGNLKDPFKPTFASYHFQKRNIDIPFEPDRRLKHSFIMKNKFNNTNSSIQNSDEAENNEENVSNLDENQQITVFVSAPIFCERRFDYVMPLSATIRQVIERVCSSLSINNPFKLKFQGMELPYEESLGSLGLPNECLLEMTDLRMINNEFLPRTKIYKFSPSVDEMKTMTISQLKCLPNFSIENEFGKIVFDSETNVTNLNVDDLVLIEKNCIIGYPNCTEEQKAFVENRLDKSAVVTLYNLKSQSGNTGKMAIKLMMNCEKNGTKFISYDEVTGNFTFRIEKL